MPRTPGKANQVSTWFQEVLRETRQQDILENKASTATLDASESLYPGLPSEDGSEIEISMTEVRGVGNPPPSQFQAIMQRLEQMEQ